VISVAAIAFDIGSAASAVALRVPTVNKAIIAPLLLNRVRSIRSSFFIFHIYGSAFYTCCPSSCNLLIAGAVDYYGGGLARRAAIP
jgi:hypothetical protein